MTDPVAVRGMRPGVGGTPPSALGFMLGLAGEARQRLGQLLAAGFFANLLALALPVFVLQVYDRVVAHAGLTTLQGLFAGMLVALAFDQVLREARSALLRRIALGIDAGLSRRLFGRILALPLRTLESRPTAEWQTLFRDVEAVRNILAGPTAVLLLDLPFALLFLGFVFVIAPAVGWVLLLMAPFYVGLGWLSGRSLRRRVTTEQKAGAERDAMLAELMAARAGVKALALDDTVTARWEERQAAGIAAAHARGQDTDRFAAWGALLTALTTLLLTTVGALAILDQRMSMGALVAANMLAGRIVMPMNQLVGAWQTLVHAWASAGRLAGLFALPPERAEAAVRHERPAGRITLEDVGFRHSPDAAPTLDRIQVDIRPGGLTGILGRNGSGKTTLLRLIRGLYAPSSGRVLLDGADLAQFGRRELADWIGYVPQETILLSGSIRDVIAGGRLDVDDTAILAAAKRAGAHGFVSALPAGYGTPVGEAGHRLSGGQRQRLAIARALVGDPPILLLDEPGTGLDQTAEDELRLLLTELARSRTVIMVTHSPLLLSACTSILLLDAGRVAGGGPAREVLAKLAAAKTGPASPVAVLSGSALSVANRNPGQS